MWAILASIILPVVVRCGLFLASLRIGATIRLDPASDLVRPVSLFVRPSLIIFETNGLVRPHSLIIFEIRHPTWCPSGCRTNSWRPTRSWPSDCGPVRLWSARTLSPFRTRFQGAGYGRHALTVTVVCPIMRSAPQPRRVRAVVASPADGSETTARRRQRSGRCGLRRYDRITR